MKTARRSDGVTLERIDAGGCGAPAMALGPGGAGRPLAMRFDLLAAVQLRGNFKRLCSLRILPCLAAAAALFPWPSLASVLLPLATLSFATRVSQPARHGSNFILKYQT